MLVLAASALMADVGKVEITADFDAEFARAADLLEEGKRAEAASVLDAIRLKARQPAWDARAAFLLAADDARRQRYEAAAERLANIPASAIGLEAYSQLRRAEALELAGDPGGALDPARRAFETEGPFSFRLRASAVYAAVLTSSARPPASTARADGTA